MADISGVTEIDIRERVHDYLARLTESDSSVAHLFAGLIKACATGGDESASDEALTGDLRDLIEVAQSFVEYLTAPQCGYCGKVKRREMDVYKAALESEIDVKHYLFCRFCFQILSQLEFRSLGERQSGIEQRAHLYQSDLHILRRFEVADIEELFFHGISEDCMQGLTIEALREIERVRSLPFIESRFTINDQGESYRAWRDDPAFVIFSERAPV